MDDPIYLGMAVYHVVPKKKEKVKFLPSNAASSAAMPKIVQKMRTY